MEYAALATASLELGLGDLPGVVPRVDGAPVPAGLFDASLTVGEEWELELESAVEGPDLVVRGTLCGPESPCEVLGAKVALDDPWPGLVRLLERIEAELDRTPSPEARDERVNRATLDPYALRLAGRAATVLYGSVPESEAPGDPKKDPVERAIRVDPSLPEAGWVAARVAIRRGRPERVPGLVQRPRLVRPSAVLLRAEEAASLSLAGETAAAEFAWTRLMDDTVDDPRFVIAAAAASLAAGEAQAAEEALARVPERAARSPRVTALLADVAAATGAASLDERLTAWAEADPSAPEPVQRRIDLRIADARYAEAVDLLDELARRGAGERADALRPGLLAALGRWREAADHVHDPELADAMRQRGPSGR